MQFTILFAVVIVVAFVFLRLLFPAKALSVRGQTNTGRLAHTERRASGRGTNAFHAVSIHPAAEGCAAAAAVKGKRFLSEEAPGLPLEECTAATCHCTYAHHIDRRRGNGERRLIYGIRHDSTAFSESGERRANPGRRDCDLEAA